MMNKRLPSALMLAVFAWMIAGPTVAAALEPSHTALVSPAHHADGAPCPDGDDDGPCDDGCPCLCCPGHATVMFPPAVASLERPHLSSVHRFGPSETDHPSGIHRRIFRPPRV
ncbi:MAG: hypothetical protein R6V85_03355 [Polyangia bacterium]